MNMYISPRSIEKAHRVVSIMAVAVFVSAFAFLLPTKTLAYTKELVTNGDFESGATGWSGDVSYIGPGRGFGQGILFQGPADYQWNAGCLWWSGPVTHTVSRSVVVPATANSFTFSAWYKGYDAHYIGVPGNTIKVYNYLNPSEIYYQGPPPGTYTDWTQVSFTKNLALQDGRVIGIELKGVECNKLPYQYDAFDDISLIANIPDIDPPKTILSLSPPVPNAAGYFTSVVATLTASDSGSGVNSTYFRLDNVGQFEKYVISPWITSSGTHLLEYYSIDNDGNVEPTQNASIQIGPLPSICTSNWQCTSWSQCSNGTQSRLCVDTNMCSGSSSKPTEGQTCTMPTPAPTPQVLGATTFHPVIKTLTLTKGLYSYKLSGKTIKITPFGSAYKGTIWARSVDFGPGGRVFVFLNSNAYKKGQIMVYNAKGKLIKAYSPYGGFATSGLNSSIVVESNDSVYLAVGTMKAGTIVKTYQVIAKGLHALNSITTSTKPGNILVGFQKVYKGQYGLITKKYGDAKSLKVWKLDLKTNKFVEDKKINKTKIKI